MKKTAALFLCVLMLAACGEKIQNADIAGDWQGSFAQIHFNEDGTYEIKYFDFEAGDLASENGTYALSGGKIEFKIRDKYTADDFGGVKFERLIHTENRKEKISLDGEYLTINKIQYQKQESN